jgi:hypothetical protein
MITAHMAADRGEQPGQDEADGAKRRGGQRRQQVRQPDLGQVAAVFSWRWHHIFLL